MRNFNEARSEYTQYLDKRADWGEERPISFGRKKGYTEVGVCGTGRAHGIVLFALDASDRSFVKGSNVKSGETVFRYATRNSIIGDIFPLVKINAKKGLLYNLTQASSEGEIETAQFETKSSKLKYLRILASASKVDGFDNYVTEQLDEATEMNESMSPAMFADLKKGDRLQIKFDSPMAKGNSGSFIVHFKSKFKGVDLEKITLVKDKKGPGVKYYLYNRKGKVTMAAGDMAVSLTNVVKESTENKEVIEEKTVNAFAHTIGDGASVEMNFFQMRAKIKESVEQVDEAVTVKKQKYSHGNVVTIAKGNSYSVILHDKEHKLVGKLEDGEKFSFSDDTGETWMAERKKKNLVFVGVRKKIIVPADKVISESVSEAFKVGDKVSVSKGPHKGQKHEIIHVKPGGGYNVKPVGLMARDIKYKLGAAGAKASDVSVWKESVEEATKKHLMTKVRIPVVKNGKVVGDVSRTSTSVSAAKVAKSRSAKFGKVTIDGKEKDGWIALESTVDEANQSGKTEHGGAKKGKGAFFGRKKAAKNDSNKQRRSDDKKATTEEVEQIDELTDKQKAEIAKRKAMRVGQAAKKKEKSAAKKADAEQKKKDNPNARGEYIDAADKGLIMQLRAAEDISNEKEHPITFRRGKTEKVPHEDVKAVLSFHDALKKPDDKRRLKIQLAKGGATAAKKLADVYRKTAGK